MVKLVLVFSVCSTSNFSKSVNSFGPDVFFRSSTRLRLSIGEVVAPTEFATKALTYNMGSVTMMEILEFHEILTLVDGLVA